MAITPVSSAESNLTSQTSPLTFTTDIGTPDFLVVTCHIVNNTTFAFDAATWNGDAMSKAVDVVREAVSGIFHGVAIYYLSAPDAGSNTFSVTVTGDTSVPQVSMVASWYNGAHQTQASVKDQHNSGNGSTDPSLSITPSENNELIIGAYLSEANSVLTVGSGENLLQDHDHGARVTGASYAIQTTATAQTIDFTGVDDEWTMVVASFKQAGGAPPPARRVMIIS